MKDEYISPYIFDIFSAEMSLSVPWTDLWQNLAFLGFLVLQCQVWPVMLIPLAIGCTTGQEHLFYFAQLTAA